LAVVRGNLGGQVSVFVRFAGSHAPCAAPCAQSVRRALPEARSRLLANTCGAAREPPPGQLQRFFAPVALAAEA